MATMSNGAASASQLARELPSLPSLPLLPDACLRSELPCDDELPCAGRYPHRCLAASIPLWSQPLDKVRGPQQDRTGPQLRQEGAHRLL